MTKNKLSETLLNDFSQFLAEKFALHFPKQKYRELERGLLNILPLFNVQNVVKLMDFLKNKSLDPDQIAIITSEFTIGETYFFRDKLVFDELQQNLLPKIIKSRRETEKYIRIWSAACSTGEEIYSIAILLSILIPDLENWNITLLATDINVHSLAKLKEGIYGDWSFRNVPEHIKSKYFNKIEKNKFQIHEKFRKMITYEYLNLAEDIYPALLNNTTAMDIILCRNCLMYFTAEFIQKIIANFKKALIEGGYFFVGGSETYLIPVELFHSIHSTNGIYFRKCAKIEKLMDNLNPTINTSKSYEDINLSPDSKALPIPLILKEMKKEIKDESNQEITEKIIEAYVQKLDSSEDLPTTLESLEETIKKDKCNPFLHYLKGLTLQELGDIHEAIKEFNKTLYLDQDFVLAYYALANIDLKNKKINSAKKYYKIVLKLIEQYEPDAILSGSGGLTAERMKEIIHATSLINEE